MIQVPVPSAYGYSVNNNTGVTPGTTPGTSVTPTQNAMGTAASLGLTAAEDILQCTVHINSAGVSTFAKDTLVDILYDPAGGTSWQVWIPTLLGSSSGGGMGSMITYFFPLWAPAGSTFAARASQNNATLTNLRVWLKLRGRARDPANCWVGTKVEAIGITTASSNGTSVTPTTGATKGSYTLLGSATQDNQFWQGGIGLNNAAMNTVNGVADFGVGASTTVVSEWATDMPFVTGSTETMSYGPAAAPPYAQAKSGANVYGRLLTSASPGAGWSMAAWGVRS